MVDETGLPAAFWEVMSGLPRQGVGSDAQTARALALCSDLADAPDILDIGCGPGRQSLVLARDTGGRVTAVDLHQPFLDELGRHAVEAGLGDRIIPLRADMRALPLDTDSVDLVWCEGAAYAMGVSTALATWRPLLRQGGYLAFSELCWTDAARPAEVEEFFATGYPSMTDVATNLAFIDAAGYELVGHFALPESSWWDEYYTPLEARLPALRERYRGDAEALAVVESTAQEIEVRRNHPDAYAYEFFVARRPG